MRSSHALHHLDDSRVRARQRGRRVRTGTGAARNAGGSTTPAEQQAVKSTVTGCVVQAKTTDGGTAYVLSKAEGGTATMYVLGGSSQPEWSANVNKKVEVIGPVQEPPNASRESAADPKVLHPPLIVVESVKVVAQTCT